MSGVAAPPSGPVRPGASRREPATWRVAVAVVMVVVAAPFGLLLYILGDETLALGLMLLVSVSAVWLLMPRPSSPWLVWLVPAALLLVAVGAITTTKSYRPDPFGLAVGADVRVDCGSVIAPGDDAYGCKGWRDDQLRQAQWMAGLAVVVTGGILVSALRRPSRPE